MKVIVKVAHAKFYDGTRYFVPEIGDEIELPDEIAEREIVAGYVAKLSSLESEMPSGKRKKIKKPVPPPEPEEDEEEEPEDEEEEPEEDEEEEPEEKELLRKKKKQARMEARAKSRKNRK